MASFHYSFHQHKTLVGWELFVPVYQQQLDPSFSAQMACNPPSWHQRCLPPSLLSSLPWSCRYLEFRHFLKLAIYLRQSEIKVVIIFVKDCSHFLNIICNVLPLTHLTWQSICHWWCQEPWLRRHQSWWRWPTGISGSPLQIQKVKKWV